MKELEYIHPSNLHTHWELIKPGLIDCSQYAHDKWLPEDVYTALKNNQATLHIGWDDNVYLGFIVLMPIMGFSGQNLLIWAVYSAGKMDYSEFWPHVKKMAKMINANEIYFDSTRRGWERKGKLLGFSPRQTRYVMEV